MKTLSSSIYAKLLPVICGAEDDPDGAGNPPDPNAQTDPPNGGNGGDGGNGGQGGGDGDSHEGDPQKKIQAQQEIIDRKQRQLDDAAKNEKELEDLRKFKKEQEDAKLSADEKLTRSLDETTAERDSLKSVVNKQAIQLAFLSNNDVTWHETDTALSLVDLSEVEVDPKTGEVKDPAKVKAAIKKLATDKPYLVKKNDIDEDTRQFGPTGNPPQRKQGGEKVNERQRLLNKYPALRR